MFPIQNNKGDPEHNHEKSRPSPEANINSVASNAEIERTITPPPPVMSTLFVDDNIPQISSYCSTESSTGLNNLDPSVSMNSTNQQQQQQQQHCQPDFNDCKNSSWDEQQHYMSIKNSEDQLTNINNDTYECDDEKNENYEKDINPIFMNQYLQHLGGQRKEALESFYSNAVGNPCRDNWECENSMSAFRCIKLWETCTQNQNQEQQCNKKRYDPFNRNIVGPITCEYCHAESTLKCHTNECNRPQLFFKRKKPPFENASHEGSYTFEEGYGHVGYDKRGWGSTNSIGVGSGGDLRERKGGRNEERIKYGNENETDALVKHEKDISGEIKSTGIFSCFIR